MNYIYDILLNFNEYFYEFFEWNLNDDIIHVRKIPIIKVNATTLEDFSFNNCRISNEFLENIKYKTEIFNNRDINTVNYACLFTDGNRSCALYLNEDGSIKMRSDLVIDEAIEVIDVSATLSESKLNYKVLNKNKIDIYKTRYEIEIEQYLIKEINKLRFEKEIEKLRYLYYECFGNKEKDIDKIMKKLHKEIKQNWDNVYNKIYSFLKISSTN